MFGNKDKVKEVTISTNDDYVIWNVDVTNVARDTTLYVEQGSFGVYIVNGVLRSTNTPGRWVINSKEDEKKGNRIQLIGVNSNKTYDIFCGIGGSTVNSLAASGGYAVRSSSNSSGGTISIGTST